MDETYIKAEFGGGIIPPPNLLVKGEDRYLYRAVDSDGNANPLYPRNGTAIRREAEPHRLLPPEGGQMLLRLALDFLLTAKRDAQAAKRFFRKALSAVHTQEPRVIIVDKNAAYPKAIDELKEKEELSEQLELRRNKYLNNMVEQDHRFIKRLVKPGTGFGSFNANSPYPPSEDGGQKLLRLRARRTITGDEIMNLLRKEQVEKVERGAVVERVEFISEIFGVAS